MKQPTCKRTDQGVVALMFDHQEGKYFSNPCPMSLEFLKASEAEDPSQRFKPVAYVELKNDEHGYPKPGQQVYLMQRQIEAVNTMHYGETLDQLGKVDELLHQLYHQTEKLSALARFSGHDEPDLEKKGKMVTIGVQANNVKGHIEEAMERSMYMGELIREYNGKFEKKAE